MYLRIHLNKTLEFISPRARASFGPLIKLNVCGAAILWLEASSRDLILHPLTSISSPQPHNQRPSFLWLLARPSSLSQVNLTDIPSRIPCDKFILLGLPQWIGQEVASGVSPTIGQTPYCGFRSSTLLRRASKSESPMRKTLLSPIYVR